MFDQRIAICHACPQRQPRCAGACACTIDGRDILEHARAGECPVDKFGGPPDPLPFVPTPFEQWPKWAKLVARMRIPADVGIGETVRRLVDRVGGERFKRIAKWLKIPCGCATREADWNAWYPYLRDA